MREDEDAHRARRFDEACGGDRLAGRGRVAEAVAPDRARILRRRELFFELLLVDDAEVRIFFLRLLGVAVAVPVQRLLFHPLIRRDQLGEHPG